MAIEEMPLRLLVVGWLLGAGLTYFIAIAFCLEAGVSLKAASPGACLLYWPVALSYMLLLFIIAAISCLLGCPWRRHNGSQN